MDQKRFQELTFLVGKFSNLLESNPVYFEKFLKNHTELKAKSFLLELFELADISYQFKRTQYAESIESLVDIIQHFEAKDKDFTNNSAVPPSWVFPALRSLGLSTLPHHRERWLQEALALAGPEITPILEAYKLHQYDDLFQSCKILRRQYVLRNKFLEGATLKLIGITGFEPLIQEIDQISKNELVSEAGMLVPILENAINLAQMIDAWGCAAKYACWKGDILCKLEGFEAALPHFRNALEYYERVIDHIPGYDMLAAALNDAIFIELAQNGRIEEGLPYLESAVYQYRHAVDREPKLVLPNLARANWDLGKATAFKGDDEKADQYYTEAADCYRKALDFQPDVFSKMAELLFEHMNYLLERKEDNRGIELAHELVFRLSNPPMELDERLRVFQVSVYIAVGDIYSNGQSFDLAEKYYRKTMDLQTAFTRDFPDRDLGLAKTQMVLAKTLLTNGKFEEAKALLIQAKAISKKWIANPSTKEFALETHAEICNETGKYLAIIHEYDLAEDEFLEAFNALALSNPDKNIPDRVSPLISEIGNRLIELYFETGKTTQIQSVVEKVRKFGGQLTVPQQTPQTLNERFNAEFVFLDQHQITLIQKLNNSSDYSKAKADLEVLEQLLPIIDPEQTPYIFHIYRYQYGLRKLYLNEPQSIELAIQLFEGVLPFFSKEYDFFACLEIRHNLGLAYRRRRNNQSEENLEKSIANYELILGELEGKANFKHQFHSTLVNLGVAYRFLNKPDKRVNLEKSEACFKKVITLFPKEQQAEKWARAHLGLAKTYNEMRIFDYRYYGGMAKASLDEAASVNPNKVNRILWGGICTEIATLYRDIQYGNIQENMKIALQFAQQAAEIFNPEDHLVEWAEALETLATIHLYLVDDYGKENHIEKGIELLQQVLETGINQVKRLDLTNIYLELGQMYFYRISGIPKDNFEHSIQCYQNALDILKLKTNKTESQTINTFIKLGTVYQNRILGDQAENLERAIHYLLEAEKMISLNTSPSTRSVLLHEMGTAYSARKLGNPEENWKKAIQYFKNAAEYTKALGMIRSWGLKMISLASLYLTRLGTDLHENAKEARSILMDLLATVDEFSDPQLWFMAKLKLSMTFIMNPGAKKAEDFDKALEILKELESFKHLKEWYPQDLGQLYILLGHAYLAKYSGEPGKTPNIALDYLEKGLAIFTPYHFPKECLEAAKVPARLNFEAGNWQKSTEQFEMLVQSHDFLYAQSIFLSSKNRHLKASQGAFIQLAYAKAKLGKVEEAVWALEKGKSQYLNEILQRERKDLSALETQAPELVNQYKTLIQQRSQLEALERNLQFKHHQPEEAEELRNQIQANASGLQAIIERINAIIGESETTISLQLQELGALLDEGTCMLCPITTEHGTLVFILHSISGKIRMEFLELSHFTANELTLLRKNWEIVVNLKTAIRQSKWENFLEAAGLHLGREIFAPLTPLLRKNHIKRCVLITFQEYSYLPFHLAYLNETGKKAYFLDDYVFSYAPSIRIWMHCKKNATLPEKKEHLLAIEDPRPTKAPKLTGAALEVAAIAGMMPYHTILRHSECTQSNILDQMLRSTCSHFSCHGHNRWDNPMLSQLLVSFDESLHLKDILNLPYSVSRLATLSACETGLPGLEIPDEVIGLPTGLIQAGFSGVIASIWSVPDFATALLMIRFYWLWKNNKMEVDIALQQAQIWVRNSPHQEKAAFLETLIDFDQLLDDPDLKMQPVEFLNWLKATPFENAFYEPKNWGAFYLMGY